jgi:hypothetical protein
MFYNFMLIRYSLRSSLFFCCLYVGFRTEKVEIASYDKVILCRYSENADSCNSDSTGPDDRAAGSWMMLRKESNSDQEMIMASGKDTASDTASRKGGDINARSSGHGTSKRGFASMDEDKQREIASKGGKAAHEKGTAHEFNSEEARQAGKAAHEKGTAHEFTSEEAREAGRKGGHAAHERGTAHEFTSEEAREAGRKGGGSSQGGRGRGGRSKREDEDESDANSQSGSLSSGHSLSSGRHGTSGQHAKAGTQSHKNR